MPTVKQAYFSEWSLFKDLRKTVVQRKCGKNTLFLTLRTSHCLIVSLYFAGNKKTDNVAGARSWNQKSRKAYGICMSLYDQHPINGKISGALPRYPGGLFCQNILVGTNSFISVSTLNFKSRAVFSRSTFDSLKKLCHIRQIG